MPAAPRRELVVRTARAVLGGSVREAAVLRLAEPVDELRRVA